MTNRLRHLRPRDIPPQILRMYEAELAIFKAQQVAGARLLADETLREFQRDYQNREVAMGARGLPTSFRLCRDFFERARIGQPYKLFPERDFIVSFADFLDFATTPQSPNSTLRLGYSLTEHLIYNINSSDNPGELMLSTGDAQSYGFRAACMVRRGDELTLLLCLTERPTSELLSSMERSTEIDVPLRPEKRALLASEPLRRQAYGEQRVVRIEGTDLLPTMAVVRFDLKNESFAGRCFMRDLGDRYSVTTDVLAAFDGDVEEGDELFLHMVAELDGYATVWEVAKTLTLLPAYLSARLTLTTMESRSTRVQDLPFSKRRELERIAPAHRPRFRTISAIRIVRPDRESVSGRSVAPPRFQVPVDGFWRALKDLDQEGKDAAGLPVKGRTWVRAHIRHREKPAPPEIKTVYIKASLADARRRIEDHRQRLGLRLDRLRPEDRVDTVLPLTEARIVQPAIAADTGHGAYVYVMRCQAHSDNLYKVGFTDRDPEIRARELSSTTSTPSPFDVIRAWAVTDGAAAERAAHDALRPMRLSANREFFLTPYPLLQDAIGSAIAPWLIGGT